MKYDFDAAIFDMDGTLLDTMPYWRYTGIEYMLAHQLPLFPDLIEKTFYTSSRKLIMENAARLGIAPDFDELVQELEAFMNRHYIYDANLKDKLVPKFLEALRADGKKLCVATGSPRYYARNGLRRLGLLGYFEFVTDNYEDRYTKDRPEYFLALAKRLGVEPARCWVFEDALYAMQSAKAAGMRVCAIEDATQRADREAIQALADRYILSYAEWPGFAP